MSEHDSYTSKKYQENWIDALTKLDEADALIKELKAENEALKEIIVKCKNTLSHFGVLVDQCEFEVKKVSE